MIKINKNLLLIVALSGGILGFANCSSLTSSSTNGNTTVVANNNAAKPIAPTETKTETASSDKVGVPECDEYIEKYEACVNSKVPEAQRGMLKTAFEAQRKGFKDAAVTPQGKSSLAGTCKQMLSTAKTSMAAYSCSW